MYASHHDNMQDQTTLSFRHVVSDFAWGGQMPPQAIEFQDVFFIEFLNA